MERTSRTCFQTFLVRSLHLDNLYEISCTIFLLIFCFVLYGTLKRLNLHLLKLAFSGNFPFWRTKIHSSRWQYRNQKAFWYLIYPNQFEKKTHGPQLSFWDLLCVYVEITWSCRYMVEDRLNEDGFEHSMNSLARVQCGYHYFHF